MKRRTVIGLGLMVGSAGVVVLPSGSYSTTTADRGGAINVADDSNAYLELETEEASVASEYPTDVTVGEITNNFADGMLAVDIRIDDTSSGNSPVREVAPENRWLGTGESAEIVATVDCDGEMHGTETVPLEITASGSDTEVSTTATVEIRCDVPESSESNEPSGSAESGAESPLPIRR